MIIVWLANDIIGRACLTICDTYLIQKFFIEAVNKYGLYVLYLQRPPSSSLSYTGPGNDDARSPGSGGTPGPLSQPPNSHNSADNGSEPGQISFPNIFSRFSPQRTTALHMEFHF